MTTRPTLRRRGNLIALWAQGSDPPASDPVCRKATLTGLIGYSELYKDACARAQCVSPRVTKRRELIAELVAELSLQIVFERLVKTGLRATSDSLRKPPNFWLAAFGYSALRAAAGCASLLVWPDALSMGLPGACSRLP